MEEELNNTPTSDDYEYKELYEFQTRTLDECRKFIAQNYLSDRDVQLLKCFNAADVWRVEEWRKEKGGE